MKKVIAKFKCFHKKNVVKENPSHGVTIKLELVIEGSKEKESRVVLSAIGPESASLFEVGKEYYVEFTQAEGEEYFIE